MCIGVVHSLWRRVFLSGIEEIGRIGVMCIIDIIDYLVSG
jgi:hypothetical protein